MSGVDEHQGRLNALQAERDEVAATRTKDDMRALAEAWLTAARARVSGSTGFVANGHSGPDEVQAVVTEFVLGDSGLRDFIVGRLEDRAGLTEKAKASKLKSLDEQIASVTADLRKAMIAAARASAEAEIQALEAQFAGEAA